MAYDPSTPYDIKKKIRDGLGSFASVFPQQGVIQGGAVSPTPIPDTPPEQAGPPAPTLVDRAQQGLSSLFGSSPAAPVSVPVAVQAPAPSPTAATGLPVPPSVRQTSISGIYEGPSANGARVFSDTQQGAVANNVRTYRRDDGNARAVANLLNSTPSGDVSGQGLSLRNDHTFSPDDPSVRMASHADFVAPDAGKVSAYAGALRQNPNALAGIVTPEAQEARAQTRIAAAGLPGAGAFGLGGVTPKDAINAEKVSAGIADQSTRTGLELDKAKDDKSKFRYSSYLDDASKVDPQSRAGLSPQDFAAIQTAQDPDATPADRQRSDAALARLTTGAFNATRGSFSKFDAIPPGGLDKFDVQATDVGNRGAGFRYATDLNGQALSADEASKREAAGQPVRYRETSNGLAQLGITTNNSDIGKALLNHPVLGDAVQKYLARRNAARKKDGQGLPKE